jgi:elongation of very long chain fatty acids protein 7
MGSPGPVLTIIATYLYFCVYAGPRYMKDRKPFDLKNTIMVYNGIQVIFSIVLVYEGLLGGWATGYSFKCQPVDYSDNPKAVRVRPVPATEQI